MKFLFQTLIIIIVTAVAETMLPWWSIIIASFIVAFFIYSTRSASFFSGFLGVGLLWFFYALFIDVKTNSILTSKVAQIFNLPNDLLISNTILLMLVASLLGAITGGFASLSGHLFREFFTRKDYVD